MVPDRDGWGGIRRRRLGWGGGLICALLLGAQPSGLRAGPNAGDDRAPLGPLANLYATQPPALFVHNAGALHVMVTNMGTIGDPRTGVDLYAARWRGHEYLHAVELWVGALGVDDLLYVSNGYEFRPSLDPSETIYESCEGAPGGRRAGMSYLGGDDDGDGTVDEEFLNGRDDDGDGQVDEDFAAVSQQMFCCEYRDDTDEAVEAMCDHRPMHLQVRQTTMAWSTAGENEFIGIRYQICNAGYEALEDVFVGVVLDGDIGAKDAAGYWEDDCAWIVSLDTTVVEQRAYGIIYECQDREGEWHDCRFRDVHLDLACMGDVPRTQGGMGGDDPPPEANGQIGLLLLSHTTDVQGQQAPSRVGSHTATYFRNYSSLEMDDFSRYSLLASGIGGSDSSDVPADYACLLSVGPFPELFPGETVDVDLALVVGHGREGLLRNAIRAWDTHYGEWRNADGRTDTGCGGRETCLYLRPGEDPYHWVDPCIWPPPAPRLIKNTECRGPQDYVDADCDCCTPDQIHYYFCDGRETLVSWVGTIVPPAPTVSTDDPEHHAHLEGDRRIFLEWDNAPELVADPGSGRFLFCGYRIWRVEGWERPLGSHGPAPGEWQLMAVLVPQPVGSQLSLAAHTNADAAVVEQVPSPVTPGEWLDRYEVGRYFYTDTLGLKNGMLYFYDVTSFGCWYSGWTYYEEGQPPAALEGDGVRPRWDAVATSAWESAVAVVPNPYRAGAAWDLTPSSADPLGTHIEFIGLPAVPCDIRIYTLAGDLVRKLHHAGTDGRGCLSWNLLSRNSQDVTSGIYIYTVTCRGETLVGRCTIVR